MGPYIYYPKSGPVSLMANSASNFVYVYFKFHAQVAAKSLDKGKIYQHAN